jgi:DNA-binding beta-propeller fold protein YncE
LILPKLSLATAALAAACLVPIFDSCASDEPQEQVLPTGMTITPLAAHGTIFQPLNPGLASLPSFNADMAVTTALSPDGKTLLILTSGYNQNNDASGNVNPAASNEYVFVFDVSSHTPRQTQVLQISVSAFDGLTWNPGGKEFYVSGGPDDLIHVFDKAGTTWQEGPQIPLNHNGVGLGLYGILPVVAGLDVTSDGKHLVAANYENDSVSAIDIAGHSVISEFDLRPGKIDPAKSGTPGGSYPYWVSIKGNEKAFVSSQRDREIIVLDIKSLPTIHVAARIPLRGQPNKMILNKSHGRLFVALDNTDSVAVIDTDKNRVVEQFGTIAPKNVFPNRHGFKGAGPNSLALSPDERTLYVTNGGTNAVSVLSLANELGDRDGDDDDSARRVVGLIPTGWYPNAVSASHDGSMLYVVNGKSVPGANPKACIDATEVTTGNSTPCTASNQYIYQIMQAGFAAIPTPGRAELEKLTAQVAKNDHFRSRGERGGDGDDDKDAEMMEFLHQRIHHILYIVKENKTYDQVLGDLEKGNGDPALVSLPEPISPNHHQLARQFVTLDNTYCSGEVSGDGWNWSAAARVTEMEQKTIQLDYSGRAPIYDFDGTNRNINVGYPTVAERQAGNAETPNDPDLLAGSRDVAEHDSDTEDDEKGLGTGYLWDAVLKAGLRVRNYGFEYIDLNRYSLATNDPNYLPPLRDPFSAGVVVSRATKPSLQPNTDPYYRGWDMNIPDYWLFKEWEREFDGYVAKGNLPSLEVIALPHDHFGSFSTAIDGVNTVETQMADNDYAFGLMVQKVANSRYKDDTLIFVIEDDAQDGPDHVDAHRTIAYVIGPYVKQGAVVSKRYSTINMLRTIEDILDLEPMGLNDGLQSPMTDVFSREHKTWKYMPIVPDVLRTTQLPLPAAGASRTERGNYRQAYAAPKHDAGYWAEKTRSFDFTRSDAAGAAQLNRIWWAGLKGEDVPYPHVRDGRDLRRNRARLLAPYIAKQESSNAGVSGGAASPSMK